MKSVNRCTFIGNLGQDPEVRYTGNGTAVANVSIACTEKWKDGEHTEWVRLVFWDKLADIAGQYLKKGDPIYVETTQRTRIWEGDDGRKNYLTEHRVLNLVMIGGKAERTGQTERPRQQPQQQEAPLDDGFDDIPF